MDQRGLHPHRPFECFFHVEMEVQVVRRLVEKLWAGLVVVMAWLWAALVGRVFIGPKAGAIIVPILGPMRGRLGADVFSHNKGGDYVRLGTTPTNPQTSRQQTTRGILGTRASQWTAGLTQDQRDAWDVYAAGHPIKNSLGQDILISGLAWYVRANARLVDAGLALSQDPPILGAPDAFNTLACDISAAAVVDVTFTGALAADEAMQLWVSLPVSLGSTPNLAQCRLAGYSGLAQASPWAAALPHSFQTGQRGVFYAAKLGEEGLISAYLQAIDDSDF